MIRNVITMAEMVEITLITTMLETIREGTTNKKASHIIGNKNQKLEVKRGFL